MRALDADWQHAGFIRSVLCQLCREPEVIDYRQQILADLLAFPALATGLQQIMPELAALLQAGAMAWPGESPLMPALGRLAELDRYVAAVDRLRETLDATPDLRSTGTALVASGDHQDCARCGCCRAACRASGAARTDRGSIQRHDRPQPGT